MNSIHLDSKQMQVADRTTGRRDLQFLHRPELGAIVAALGVFGVFVLLAGDRGFLSTVGTVNYLEVAALLGIVAAPVALLMIAGEFDLSIGSVIGFSGLFLAISTTRFDVPIWFAIPLVLFLSSLIGLSNGILVTRTKLPSFIVTLASMFVFRGVTIAGSILLTGNAVVGGVKRVPDELSIATAFTADIYGFPIVIAWWLLLTAMFAFVLDATKFGNWVYGAGGEPSAARAMGVPVARVKIMLFVLTSACAGLVGVFMTLDSGTADALRGQAKEFQAITAVVIGGTLLTGGYGSAIGAAIGALIFGIVSQGIYFTGIDGNWFQTMLGLMLIVAVIVNRATLRGFGKGSWK